MFKTPKTVRLLILTHILKQSHSNLRYFINQIEPLMHLTSNVVDQSNGGLYIGGLPPIDVGLLEYNSSYVDFYFNKTAAENWK